MAGDIYRPCVQGKTTPQAPAGDVMKQYRFTLFAMTSVILFAVIVMAAAFLALSRSAKGASASDQEASGPAANGDWVSLVDRLATIDPSYLTRPPTAGPSPTPPAFHDQDVTVGTPAAPAGESPAEPANHVVQPGENLYRISLAYGVTVDSIMAANGLANSGLIQAGQTLIIPASSAPEGAATGSSNPATAPTLQPTASPIKVTNSPPTETPLPPTTTPTETATPTETPTPTPTRLTTVNGIGLESFLAMPENVIENSRAIFAAGQTLGRNPGAFSKLGDSTIENPHFLARYDEGPYNLGDYAYLQGVVDHFAGSHSRQGMAVRRGNHSWTVTDPMWADKTYCLPNETPIACEIRLHNPSVIFIRLGSNDRGVPAGFDQNLRQVVQIAIDNGVIPVLGTKADRFEGSNINNEMIRQVAADYQVPLWDFDLVAATIPGRGLDVDAVHLTTFYAHDYTSPTAYQRGHGVHNLTALMVLEAVWREIMQGSGE